MLNKTIVPNSQDLRGESPVEILKVSSKGLDKTASMQKRAAAFEKQISQIKPLAKKAYLHVITTCASEVFGPNRNNDAYNEAEYDFHPPLAKEASLMVHVGDGLRKCHKTYLDGAHVYQEHRTEEEPSGIVKAAMYNEPMHRGELLIEVDVDKWADRLHKRASGQDIFLSIGCQVATDCCFAKGTLVLTEKGYKQIQDIRCGDVVFTNNGNWKRVTQTMSRQADIFTTIKCAGLTSSFQSTNNHPLAVVRQKYIRNCSGSVITRGKRQKRRHSFYLNNKCTTCNKQLQLPIQYIAACQVTQDDYLAIRLDKNNEKDTVGKSFAYLCGMYLGDGFPTFSSSRTFEAKVLSGIGISASALQSDRDVLQKVKNTFYIYSGRQLNLQPESGGKRGYKCVLNDPKLAQRILSYVGFGSHTKYISKTVLSWSTQQKLSFLGGCFDSDGCVGRDRDSLRYSTVNKSVALGIQRLCWSVGIPATVAVHINRTGFIAEGLAYTVYVANKRMLLQDYSAKAARIYGEKKLKTNQSVILLGKDFAYLRVKDVKTLHRESIEVYNLEVQDDHTYNADGIDVHNCSACGNRAHTLDEHCDHIKKQAGLMLEDGTRICMINDNPKFYDISGVNVPADTMAYVLRKVASGASAEEAITNKYLVNATRPAMAFTKAAAVLDKLSKLQKELVCCVADDPLFIDDKNCEDDFLSAVENFETDDIIDMCNRKAILLSPRALFKLMGKGLPDHDLFDMYADNCCCDCKNLMQDMEFDPQFKKQLVDGCFDTVKLPDINLANIIESFVPELGVSRPALNSKAIRIEIRIGAPGAPKEDTKQYIQQIQSDSKDSDKYQDKNQKNQEEAAEKEKEDKEDIEKTASLVDDEFRRTYARYVISFAARNNQDTCQLAMQKLARYVR